MDNNECIELLLREVSLFCSNLSIKSDDALLVHIGPIDALVGSVRNEGPRHWVQWVVQHIRKKITEAEGETTNSITENSLRTLAELRSLPSAYGKSWSSSPTASRIVDGLLSDRRQKVGAFPTIYTPRFWYETHRLALVSPPTRTLWEGVLLWRSEHPDHATKSTSSNSAATNGSTVRPNDKRASSSAKTKEGQDQLATAGRMLKLIKDETSKLIRREQELESARSAHNAKARCLDAREKTLVAREKNVQARIYELDSICATASNLKRKFKTINEDEDDEGRKLIS